MYSSFQKKFAYVLLHPLSLFTFADLLLFSLLYVYAGEYCDRALYMMAFFPLSAASVYFFVSKFRFGDKYIFLICSMLCMVGVSVISRVDSELGFAQFVWYVTGFFVFILCSFVFYSFKIWGRLQWFYFTIAMLLFLITFVYGKVVFGAKNWLEFSDGRYFQPSELIKILFVFFLSSCFCRPFSEKIYGISEKYIIFIASMLFSFFLIMQREWGTAVLLFLIYLFYSYVYDGSFTLMAASVATISSFLVWGYRNLTHIQVRIDAWLDPFSDAAGRGYQIVQSLFAMAAGGFFGRGFGNGNPQFIPNASSDFIFSAICEEFGLLFAIAIILLYFILVYRGFRISLMLGGGNKSLSFGIALMFALQTFVIIGGVIKLIPLTGITMPFVSYGGTSVVVCFASLGILQALSAKSVVFSD